MNTLPRYSEVYRGWRFTLAFTGVSNPDFGTLWTTFRPALDSEHPLTWVAVSEGTCGSLHDGGREARDAIDAHVSAGQQG